MKHLEVTAVKEDTEELEELLASLQLRYSRFSNRVNDNVCAVYSLIVPDEMVDDLIAQVSRPIDLRKKENVIAVYSVDATVSHYLNRLQEKAREKSPAANPLEAIVQPLDKFLRITLDHALMVALASVVALIGLLLDNVALIIGAMLLSPLLGPINTACVNANLGRIKHLIQAETVILGSVAISIGVAFVISAVASRFLALGLTEQIFIRSDVTVVDVVVAILLGSRGASP